MLPSLLSRQIIQGLQSFVITGFETSTPRFSGAFRELVETPGRFFKGPYLSVDLPFRSGDAGTGFFRGLETGFTPYLHQQQAWQRLASDREAKSTLIATGTGSGKTECFLYPLLDHCIRHPGPGVKVVVVYPMNALASDQARRFARTIHRSDTLRGRVRVGLFVGGLEAEPVMRMGPEQVITHKEVLREEPPDILLTNYKMLDFLLLRPRDQALWRHNGPGTLRYLVVDELHTFDGAQGTDLACLIRRLKARLLPGGGEGLICVGTSATLGSDDQAPELIRYAGRIFQTEFGPGSLIGERRQGVGEFLNLPIEHIFTARKGLAGTLDPVRHASTEDYLRAQYALFFPGRGEARLGDDVWRMALGEELKRHLLFNNLLRLLGEEPKDFQTLMPEFAATLPQGEAREHARELLDALCALVAVARGPEGGPLVHLRLQLWVRELRRIVAPVRTHPDSTGIPLEFADDLKSSTDGVRLPLVQCNRCHATAWLTRMTPGQTQVETDLRLIYNDFFRQEPETVVLLPLEADESPPPVRGRESWLCGGCGQLQGDAGDCLSCGEGGLQRVFMPDLVRERQVRGNPRLVSERNCPVCGQRDSLLVFGSQSASLASVAIHHCYASPFNDDKKLIAFSDSVQDAAHRAGFFGARTWSHNVRMAMTQALPENGMPLKEFWKHFPGHWRRRMPKERFVAEFIAPNMTWMRDYVALEETGRLPEGSDLPDLIDRRLEWEVFAEFGHRASVGRSLERTGIAVLGFDPGAVARAVQMLWVPLREQEGLVTDEESLRWFILGVLLRLKQRGAVHHEMIEDYVGSGCKSFILHRIPWMPDFHRQSLLPTFLLEGKARAGFEGLIGGRQSSWYQKWLHKCLGERQILLPEGAGRAVYARVLPALESVGLLRAMQYQGCRVWALDPAGLFIDTRVAVLETGRARDRLHVPRSLAGMVEGMPSLVPGDPGRYGPAAGAPSWLEKLYRHGDIRRVIAREHTGLLDRETRQALERDFTRGDKPWQPNLLSATPTLEMGIDIGELSSLLLCSVPPTQANYLQRVGRAGRRDGNAFTMTVAAGAPHDLYFYADPLQMMAGQVEPPGVFLNASAVISRQLTAFCLDKWVQTGDGGEAVPRTLKPVLDSVERGELERFPYNFLGFVRARGVSLLDEFFSLFEEDLSEPTRRFLREFVLGEGVTDGLEMRLVKRLTEIAEERKAFRRQVDGLKRHIEKLKRQPQDEATRNELEEATREREALMAMLRRLNARQALNFLTDEGVIPNYAFPEEGVTLRSVIYRRKQAGEGFENVVYEYERPGASAIGELVPNSRFYAGGRKVTISRIDLKLSQPERWRFCPGCSHSRREAGAQPEKNCPRCGDPMWGDSGQVATLLRLRQVMATTSDRESRIGDDADDRDAQFYNRQMLVDIDPSKVELAYGIASAEIPFGFEFARGVVFREVNFGEFGAGTETAIAGERLARQGFSLCRHCGVVQPRRQADEPRHAYTCPARKDDPGDASHFLECLYLYREFSSEALRILMPASGFGEERALNSFIAALQLGLKLKFGGQVDHLRVMSYSEPAPEGDGRRRYLVLYDSVPGGTGYLQDLLQTPQALFDVFQRAHDRMIACPCNREPGKDGCYRCLYAYRNSYGMESTSRSTAVDLMSSILQQADRWEEIETVAAIPVNPVLDSALEPLFIGALAKPRTGRSKVTIRQQVVNGRPGYFLAVGERCYTIEPHVLLGHEAGVALPSEADFLIRSVTSREGREMWPVAVFLDGFRYHKDKVADDSAKRYALVRSGRFRVWSLTWDDVQGHYAGKLVQSRNPFAEQLQPGMRPLVEKLGQRLGVNDLYGSVLMPPLDLLLGFLADPDESLWRSLAFVRMLCWFDQGKMCLEEEIARVERSLVDKAPDVLLQRFRELRSKTVARLGGGPGDHLVIDCVLPPEAVSSVDPGQAVCNLWLDDEGGKEEAFKRDWQAWLRAYNLLQFIPDCGFATARGMKSGVYEAVPAGRDVAGHESGVAVVRQSVLDEVVDEVRPALRRWLQEGGKIPEIGYELEDEAGAVVAEAELAWPGDRVAGLVPEQLPYQKTFMAQGWQVIELDAQGQWLEKVAL